MAHFQENQLEKHPFLDERQGGKVNERVETIGWKSLRWVLRALMWAAVVLFAVGPAWVPTESGKIYYERFRHATTSSYDGYTGSFILVWGSPILFLVFCGTIYLGVFPRSSRRVTRKKAPRASLATQPVIVSGPFGVVTAAELLCIVAFLVILTWTLVVSIVDNKGKKGRVPDPALWRRQLKIVAIRLGFLGQICLSLLFLPVARGSVLLRLLDIPFEHATKYHVWLGHFTMSIFTLHGFLFILAWTTQGNLIAKVLAWKTDGISNLPGVIALMAGLLMWVTSFQYTRIRFFELFFYTHQLYIIFIIFMALHVGDFFFGIALAGIFLFAFDRFLRFCQSRKEVGILSAKVLPCGTFELVLPKPPDLQYTALSFLFLNIPALGRLQWHPFSVSSSPTDAKGDIKFLIKPLGTWTQQLHEAISEAAAVRCPLGLKAAVEGPYGHETSYFLEYEALLLVAGGIGVTPFVAIIRDLLHRFKLDQVPLPRDVTLIWAVKNHAELAILDSLSPTTIFPEYASQLSLTVKAYVTREMAEDLEVRDEELNSQADLANNIQSAKYNPSAAQKPVCHLSGSGNILWVGVAIFSSLLGYVLLAGLIGNVFHNSYPDMASWSVRGIVVCLAMVLGIWLFGGSAILVWYLVGSKSIKRPSSAAVPLLGNSEENASAEIPEEKLVTHANTVYGSRPDLQDAFEGFAKRLTGINVGVLVCGPEGLQSNVASQCRAFNTLHYNHHKVAFSYHSVSFDL